jgi:hypothetical protein
MELNHRRAGLQPTALPIELPIPIGADGENQTHNLLFTKQPLCHLSYISNTVGAGAYAHSLSLSAVAFPHERLCPNVYTIHIVKERPAEHKKTPAGVNRPGSLIGASLEGSIFEPSKTYS